MGTAGPGGAGHADERSAEGPREYARQLRSLPVDQVLGDFLFSLINAAQVKLGRRDARLLIDVTAVAHEHAPLPTSRTHQADRPGAGTVADGSGERGRPRESARPAGRERPGQHPGPADRPSIVTPRARHAASLPYELRDAREPPICALLPIRPLAQSAAPEWRFCTGQALPRLGPAPGPGKSCALAGSLVAHFGRAAAPVLPGLLGAASGQLAAVPCAAGHRHARHPGGVFPPGR